MVGNRASRGTVTPGSFPYRHCRPMLPATSR